MSPLQDRLNSLSAGMLRNIRRGIEKESLRVSSEGRLSQQPHPVALGSALTHPYITTDFSEAQLELITGVHAGVEACLEELTHIHQVVFRNIGDELLWCASMPVCLPAEHAIPIGQYGGSNVGRIKTVYRIGLSHRYGRRMQTISGIHYNFSLPELAWRALPGGMDANAGYFALIRNFRRHAWLLLYLFGASPAVCSTFVEGRDHHLQELKPGTLYRPFATSLRMGPLGYQSEAQASLSVSYNSLASYGASLQEALTRPYAAYESIGIRDGDAYRQLATSLLQIENEFYGTIRPKRTILPGERPLHALRKNGVEYVEVRLMDLDPFCPIGITPATIRFLDVFLLHCLLSDSPPDSPQELKATAYNQHRVAADGRLNGLSLERRGQDVKLAEWGAQVLDECRPIAAALDAAHGGNAYGMALSAAVGGMERPDSLPSARMLEDMHRQHADSFTQFGFEQSKRHASSLRAQPLEPSVAERFERLAQESLAEQRRIEAADRIDFDSYRQQYLAHELLG